MAFNALNSGELKILHDGRGAPQHVLSQGPKEILPHIPLTTASPAFAATVITMGMGGSRASRSTGYCPQASLGSSQPQVEMPEEFNWQVAEEGHSLL